MTVAVKIGNRLFVSLGYKGIIISPHATEEFLTIKGKLRKIQLAIAKRIVAHLLLQKDRLIEIIDTEGVSPNIINNLGKEDPDFRKDVFDLLTDSARLGGQQGIRRTALELSKKGMKAPKIRKPVILPYHMEDSDIFSWINKYGATLITNVDEATMDVTRGIIIDGLARGRTNREIAETLEKKFTDWTRSGFGLQSRAEMIARTETARAMNMGTLDGYRQSGLVTHVLVVDNEQERSCSICEEANGETWTLEESEENPIEHPNCTRSFIPIVEIE